MNRRNRTSALLLLLWVAGVACSDVDRTRLLARLGDAGAQLELAEAYTAGRGVAPDPVEAARWYRAAAKAGMPEAQLALARLLAAQEGGERAEAVAWLRRAAELGLPEAQFELGRAYARGEGVAADPAEAAKWYRAAAEQGHAPAQYEAAVAYEVGRGVPLDLARALEWLHRAAAGEHAPAQFDLGRRYETGEGVPKDIDHAGALYQGAADQGHHAAQTAVGLLLEPAEAARWFRLAAGGGDPPTWASPTTPDRVLRSTACRRRGGSEQRRSRDTRVLRTAWA
jgi:TPR repeat protein